jgi:hypothetical protein
LPGRDQQALDAVASDLPAAADVREHQRLAHRGRLDRGAGHALAPGGQHEDVHQRQQVPHVLTPAGEDHVLAGRFDLGLADRIRLVAVDLSGDQEADVAAG